MFNSWWDFSWVTLTGQVDRLGNPVWFVRVIKTQIVKGWVGVGWQVPIIYFFLRTHVYCIPYTLLKHFNNSICLESVRALRVCSLCSWRAEGACVGRQCWVAFAAGRDETLYEKTCKAIMFVVGVCVEYILCTYKWRLSFSSHRARLLGFHCMWHPSCTIA